jgi:hypothetical protein
VARKAETTFIASVHKRLAKEIHREKMNNPYRSGTADVWYSGYKSDLWIEYKFLPTLPKRINTEIVLDLTENQKLWLQNRHKEGRQVAVICGCRAGGVVFIDLDWEDPITVEAFLSRVVTRQELAQWICAQTGAALDGSNSNHLQNSRISQSDL